MVPTSRKVYAYDDDKRKVSEPLLVGIEILDIAFP